jgi:hypothetical protein
MTLLATKIAELVDELISSQDEVVIWRGDLGTQNWKIVIYRNQEKTYRLTVNAEKRDRSEGDPE